MYIITLLAWQGTSQDFGSGCPKLAIVILLGVLFFKVDHSILRLCTNINMHLLNVVRLNILIQYYENYYIEGEKSNYMLEIHICRITHNKFWVS